MPLLEGGTYPVKPILAGTDPELVRRAAVSGAGIACCAVSPLPVAEADSLVQVLPDIVGRSRPIRIVVPRLLMETPNLRAVFRFARILLGGELTER